jgi:hypothetical protein
MILFLYAAFCIGFALYNYDRIERGKRIYHGVNGFIHLFFAVLCTVFGGWKMGVSILLIARLFFDISLNAFRGLPLGYVSPDPKSIVDKIEKKIFKNGYLPKIIYVCILILFQI